MVVSASAALHSCKGRGYPPVQAQLLQLLSAQCCPPVGHFFSLTHPQCLHPQIAWVGLSSICYNKWITREELIERGFEKMVNEYDGKLAAEQKVWGKCGGGEV